MSGIASSKEDALHSTSKEKTKPSPITEFVLNKGNGKIRKTLGKEDQCTTTKDQQRLARKRITSRIYWRKKRAEEDAIVSRLTKEKIHLQTMNNSLASKNQALREYIAQIRSVQPRHQQFRVLNPIFLPYQQSQYVQSAVIHQTAISNSPPHFQQLLYQKLLTHSVPQQPARAQMQPIAPMSTAINPLILSTHQNAGLNSEHLTTLQQTTRSLNVIAQRGNLDLHSNSSNIVTSVMNSVAQPIGATALNRPFALPAVPSGLAFNMPSMHIEQLQKQPLIPCAINIIDNLSSPAPTAKEAEFLNDVAAPPANDMKVSKPHFAYKKSSI